MRKRTSPNLNLALACCLLLAASIVPAQRATPMPPPSAAPNVSRPPAQQPTPARTPTDETEDDVVRITSNLVQVDAVVTDRDGKHVTDLSADEIEIFEDGRQQKITNFSYISNEPGAVAARLANPTATSSTVGIDRVAPPAARLRPEQVLRTVALVADDICASFESIAYIRQALKKYVDEQMQPGDMVSITRTVGGTSALQNFTNNKQQLYAAIERVRWSPMSTRCANSLAPLESDPFAQTRDQNPASINNDSSERSMGEDAQNFSEQIFAIGTLGAVNHLIRGLREMPGRKAVVLLSDGIAMLDRRGDSNDRLVQAVNRLTDLANRASVVIYTIDARGLQTLALTAADSTSGMSREQVEKGLASRRRDFAESQNGLIYLAEQTGGFAIRNSNDIAHGIRRVMDDQRGYYLIGYRPDEKTFDVKGRREFHRLTAKVKRPGLRVRLRSGFFGLTEENARPIARTRGEQMVAALNSPFKSGGVGLRLTTLFGDDEKQGPFMRSMLHINARDLTFEPQPDGWQKAVIDVLAVTFVENGNLVDQVNTTHTMRTRGKTYEYILKNGLVFNLNVPVKKPGAYQLRIAVRDTATEKVGAASQFIEVPNLGKDQLALSGIVVTTADTSATTNTPTAPTDQKAGADSASGEQQTEPDPQAGPAVRRFRQGSALDYYYHIYNAKPDRATGQPQLVTQARLFRDGQAVFTGQPTPFNPGQQPDPKRIMAGSRLRLGSNLPPGEYMLQVVVTDKLAKEKRQLATQWIDFEIIK